MAGSTSNETPHKAVLAARLTVGDLEKMLFDAFPATDALEGDRIGLLAGDVAAPLSSIVIALDATVEVIERAAACGCNVLVTHHPVFWNPPELFLREVGTQAAHGAATSAAAAVYRAAEKGVSLIAMHTNLDCAPAAAGLLLDPVGYEYVSPLMPHGQAGAGLGQLGIPRLQGSGERGPISLQNSGERVLASLHSSGAEDSAHLRSDAERVPISLQELARRYGQAFGAVAKAWGEPSMSIYKLAACPGGAGEVVKEVIASGADCFVTGEVRYHEALELAAAGVALIELGHDRSELPFRFYLRDALMSAGIPEDCIHVIEPLVSWWQSWKVE